MDEGLMSVNAYAKHRGVYVKAVQDAIQRGRLKRCITLNEKGQPKINNVPLADKEWEENRDPAHANCGRKRKTPPPRAAGDMPPAFLDGDVEGGVGDADLDDGPATHEGMTQAKASARRMYWQAKAAELEYRRKAGELVPAKDVLEGWQNVVATSRTKLLSIPSKAKAALPKLTHADVATLDRLVREALEELAQANPLPAEGEAA